MRAFELTTGEIALNAPFRRQLPDGQPTPEGAGVDDRTLVYDVFRTHDGEEIRLLGPPAIGVEGWLESVVSASLPAGAAVQWIHDGRILRAWIHTRADEIHVQDDLFEPGRLIVQPNMSTLFEGRRVVFAIQKDNDLNWIRDWAHAYAHLHGGDAVLVYDNGSTRYSPDDLRSVLSAVPGVQQACVVPWNFPYGILGLSNFCQRIMLEHARWRCLAGARSVVNADIDELALSESGASIFDIVEASPTGYVQALGVYMSDLTPPTLTRPRHRDMIRFADDPLPSPPKWAVIPSRCPRTAVWRPHFISDMPASQAPDDFRFRHFKALASPPSLGRQGRLARPVSLGSAGVDETWRRAAAQIPWVDGV